MFIYTEVLLYSILYQHVPIVDEAGESLIVTQWTASACVSECVCVLRFCCTPRVSDMFIYTEVLLYSILYCTVCEERLIIILLLVSCTFDLPSYKRTVQDSDSRGGGEGRSNTNPFSSSQGEGGGDVKTAPPPETRLKKKWNKSGSRNTF